MKFFRCVFIIRFLTCLSFNWKMDLIFFFFFFLFHSIDQGRIIGNWESFLEHNSSEIFKLLIRYFGEHLTAFKVYHFRGMNLGSLVGRKRN